MTVVRKLCKVCRGCGVWKPVGNFEKRYDRRGRRGARLSRCRECMKPARSRHGKRNYRRHREAILARIHANRVADPSKHRAAVRRWKLTHPEQVRAQRERENARRRKASA
jgi:hypothetical protein